MTHFDLSYRVPLGGAFVVAKAPEGTPIFSVLLSGTDADPGMQLITTLLPGSRALGFPNGRWCLSLADSYGRSHGFMAVRGSVEEIRAVADQFARDYNDWIASRPAGVDLTRTSIIGGK